MSNAASSPSYKFADIYEYLDDEGKPVTGTRATMLDINSHVGAGKPIRVARHKKDRVTGAEIPENERTRLVAVKWARTGVTGFSIQRLMDEAKVMREVGDHEHILKLEDFLIEDTGIHTPFDEPILDYFLVIQYAAGQDLLQWIRNGMKQWDAGTKTGDQKQRPDAYVHLSLPVTRTVARQTLLALKYVHTKNIWHRDCKPDNLFIRDEFPADLVDMVPLQHNTTDKRTETTDTYSPTTLTTTTSVMSTPSNVSRTGAESPSLAPNNNINWDEEHRNGGLLTMPNSNRTTNRISDIPTTPSTANNETNKMVRYELWVRPEFARRRAGFNDSVIFTGNNKPNEVPGKSPTPATTTPTTPVVTPSFGDNHTNQSTDKPVGTKDPIPYILLSDFDHAKLGNRKKDSQIRTSMKSIDAVNTIHVGNEYFRAPETDFNSYDCSVDIWSLGLTILYTYCSGIHIFRTENKVPFPDINFLNDSIAGYKQIGKYGLIDQIYDRINEMVKARGRPLGIDPELGDLLKCMLKLDRTQRITASKALEHPFFNPLPHLQALRVPRIVSAVNNDNWSDRSPKRVKSDVSSNSINSAAIRTLSVAGDGTVPNPLFEEIYNVLLKTDETISARNDAFCTLKDVVRLSHPVSHPYLPVGSIAKMKWYPLDLMGETAHLEAEEVNKRRFDYSGKPLRHEHLSTVYDVYSQYYPPLPYGTHFGDPGTEKCHPSLIMVVEPAKGPPLDQFLLKQGERIATEWKNDSNCNYYVKRWAKTKRSPTVDGTGTEISPDLAHIICGPHLTATIIKQLLSAVRYLHNEKQYQQDIRMYAVLLRDNDTKLVGKPKFPDPFCQSNLLVQAQLELDMEPASNSSDPMTPRISHQPLPHVKLSPVNPIRAGDSYDYTDFVLQKSVEQRKHKAALDLWAIGDLLFVMLTGIQVKPRLASLLATQRRSYDIAAPALDILAQEVIDNLQDYDPLSSDGPGSDTVKYIDDLLQLEWFQRYGNVVYSPPTNITPTSSNSSTTSSSTVSPLSRATTNLSSPTGSSTTSNVTINETGTIPTELPPNVSSTSSNNF